MTEEEGIQPEEREDKEPTIGQIVAGTAEAPKAVEKEPEAEDAAGAAHAADAADAPAASAASAAASKLAGLPMGAWAGIAVAALVIGIVIGFAAFGHKTPANSVSGAATVEQAKLDSAVVATYTYDGKETSVTAQEVLESSGALDYYADEDGNYRLPGTDMTVSYIRNQVLVAEAEKRGISVSDDELAEYAEQYIGTSDFAMLAEGYGMTEDAIRNILRTSYLLEKLQDAVVSSDGGDAAMPDEPPMPASYSEDSGSASADAAGDDLESSSATVDDEDFSSSADEGEEGDAEDQEQAESSSASSEDPNVSAGLTAAEAKQYADYIIALAGDEWDSSTGTWASPDGEYASALAQYNITADSASYEAAMTAYYVAYQRYALASSAPTDMWEQFTNDLFAKVSVTLYTLVS